MEADTKEEKKTEMVDVGCRVVNGIWLKRFHRVSDDGPMVAMDMGYRIAGPSGHHAGFGNIGLDDATPGVTSIPREWIEAWLKENAITALVTKRYVFIIEDKKPDEAVA